MPDIPPISLPITGFAQGRQDQNLSFRQGQEPGAQLQNRDNTGSAPPNFVFRGEVLEEPNNQDRRYRPQFNQDIDPQNREAIGSYQQIAEELTGLSDSDSPSGRIVDFFI